ncbi:MAG: UvrD-helicase domain-containing protein, partial [Catalinimonas sp.]
MTPPARFRIYRSSAGSGKTYTLTREYLRLVLVEPARYREVLAVTFTNKATAEMKERIVAALYKLRHGRAGGLAQELADATGLPVGELPDRAGRVLAALLHDYSHFSVSTIDSFFQRVLRAFAYEAAQNLNFRLELDSGQVMEELTDRLIMELGPNPELTHWLIRFAEERVGEGHKWDFRGDLRQLTNEVLKEQFRGFERDLPTPERTREELKALYDDLEALRTDFEDRLRDVGRRAEHVMARHELTPVDFMQGERGVGGFFRKLAAGQITDTNGNPMVSNSYVQKALVEDAWYKKKSPRELELRGAIDAPDGLLALLQEAADFYAQEFPRYRTGREIRRFLYAYGILSDLTEHLRKFRAERDVLLISDVAHLLHEIVGGNDAHYIYEKTGAHYRHFLIDEFQDTSGLQWENFRPLIVNSLAEGHDNLIVGDVKQSIYRWRGGDWQLLLRRVADDVPDHEAVALSRNWRSAPRVVEFNNLMFYAGAAVLREHLMQEVQALPVPTEWADNLTAQLTDAYREIRQQVPDGKAFDHDGHAQITFVEGETKGEWQEAALLAAVQRLEELQACGYDPADVALLVRTKSEGRRLAEFMLDYARTEAAQPGCCYDVISSESLYLYRATTVRLLISALRCLKNPRDRVSTAQLLHDWSAYLCDRDGTHCFEVPDETADPAELEALLGEHLPPGWIAQRANLSRLPLYELIEHLVLLFALHKHAAERAYLQAFLDAVLDYGRQEKTDVPSFLQWWDDRGRYAALRAAGGRRAATILTIHTAKGLEYPVVLVPFADWDLDHGSHQTNVLWIAARRERPFDRLARVPVKYGTALRSTLYAEEYFAEQTQAYLDNLNVLYVAFTRAREALYAFAPRPGASQIKRGDVSLKRVGGLLYRVAPLMADGAAGDWDAEANTLTWGVPPPCPEQKQHGGGPEQLVPNQYTQVSWRTKLTIKSEAEAAVDRIGGEEDGNQEQLLHDLLKS